MNLNDIVSFHLTEVGIRYLLNLPLTDVPHVFWPQLPNLMHLREHSLVLPQPLVNVAYELTLWEFCATFGPGFSMLAEPFVQNNEVTPVKKVPGALTAAALSVLEATRLREMATDRGAKHAAGLLLHRRLTEWRAAGFPLFEAS
jgi:hypothetical protein